MKQKGRIQRLEQGIAPKRFITIKVISHLPGEPKVQTFVVPASRVDQSLMTETVSRALPDER